jgi:hypothetical protein
MNMEWHEGIEAVRPYVVRITTPRGSGTGWLVSRSRTSDLVGVATAAHVIDHAHYWEQPIRLHHISSGETVLLRAADRAIHLDESRDSAGIVFGLGNIPFPAATLPLITEGKFTRPGVEIGWLGFPAMANTDLCFFSGRISTFVESTEMYLVDGVAINGVSGGPAFRVIGGVDIIGVVSAYIPNRATGEVLPGLAVVRDVTQFHDLANRFKNFDDAKARETAPGEVPPPSPEADATPSE